MADAQTDHDMADLAVVEHPHPHEDEEHVEWEHPKRGTSTTLDPVQVRAGVEREKTFMGELGVGEPCDRPKTGKVWSRRWRYRRKGDSSEEEQIPVYMRVHQDQLGSPRISGEPTCRCRVHAGHDGSVHLQQRGRRCEDVSTRR